MVYFQTHQESPFQMIDVGTRNSKSPWVNEQHKHFCTIITLLCPNLCAFIDLILTIIPLFFVSLSQ